MNFTTLRWTPVLGIIILCGISGRAMARPPSEMTLSYDAEKRNLHIEARHVTSNPRKHFIRKLFIDKNGTEVDSRSYVQQTTATMFIEDISLEAVMGDVLRVEAICNEAGRNDATFVIP